MNRNTRPDARHRTALAAIVACLAMTGPAPAQQKPNAQPLPSSPQATAAGSNPASEPTADPQAGINDRLRRQIGTVGRYAAEVVRHSGQPGATPSTGTHSPRQADLMVDPFEVSPQLREGRNRTPFTGLPGANVLELKRRIQLRAVLRTAQGTLAQLLINNKDVVTIMDKELIDLGDLGTFQAEIQTSTVSLSNPNNPQGKKVVLR